MMKETGRWIVMGVGERGGMPGVTQARVIEGPNAESTARAWQRYHNRNGFASASYPERVAYYDKKPASVIIESVDDSDEDCSRTSWFAKHEGDSYLLAACALNATDSALQAAVDSTFGEGVQMVFA